MNQNPLSNRKSGVSASFLLVSLIAVVFFAQACVPKPVTTYDPPREYALLPIDEAPHPKNSLEWWYLTGHLYDADSLEYGIEYVFFHFTPRGKREYMMVNVAISDPQKQTFHYDYKIARAKEGLSFALPVQLYMDKKKERWSLNGQEGKYTIKAQMVDHPGYGFELKTEPIKDILLHAGKGYEDYGGYAKAGYYSFPRMSAEGKLWVEGKEMQVSGELWYDRQWNCIGVVDRNIAWDWMSVQLNEHQEEIMLYTVHHYGDGVEIMGGTYFNASGENIYLPQGSFTIKETDFWKSPVSKGSYPIAWEVEIPAHELSFTVKAKIPQQELNLNFGLGLKLHYWEGMCEVKGFRKGQPFTGNSYVEITNRNRKR